MENTKRESVWDLVTLYHVNNPSLSFADYANARSLIQVELMGISRGNKLEIKVKGKNLDTLKRIAEEIKTIIEKDWGETANQVLQKSQKTRGKLISFPA